MLVGGRMLAVIGLLAQSHVGGAGQYHSSLEGRGIFTSLINDYLLAMGFSC